MRPRLFVSLILVTLSPILVAAAPDALPSTAPAKLPFTLGKDTTIITGPLLPDGTPDYVGALNNKYGKGVTPDNNALIPLLQIRSVEQSVLSEDLLPEVRSKLIARFLELAGAKPGDPNALTYETYNDYIKHNNLNVTPDAASAELFQANHPWTEKDLPTFAAYLKSQDRFFDIAAKASERSRFYVPYVSANGHITGIVDYYFIGFSIFSRAWVARAMLRAGSHDLEGAIHDLVALKRLARLLNSGESTINILLARVFDANSGGAVADVAASGDLTESQCDALAKEFDLPAPLAMAMDEPMYRWRMLDYLIILAQHNHVALPAHTEPESLAMIASLDTSAVDWNLALRTFNEQRDHDIELVKTASFDELDKVVAAFKAKFDQAQEELKQSNFTITKGPAESNADYTRRIVGAFASNSSLSIYAGYDKDLRITNMRSTMVQALLAAAKFKAHTGQWPKTLDTLVPAYLKQIPTDLYAATPAPIHYDITSGHPRIFSVGPDHLAGTADDSSIPEPPAPTTPSNLP